MPKKPAGPRTEATLVKLLLPLLLTPLASLQRTRRVATSPAQAPEPMPSRHDAGAEPDWRHAYLRLRDEQAAPAGEASAPVRSPLPVADIEPAGPPAPPVSRTERQPTRPRLQQAADAPDHFEPLLPATTLMATAPVVPEAATVQVTTLTPTAERIAAAAREVGAPAPALPAAARVWQVELPSSGSSWQLRVEQAQPQAPLKLELHVPAVLQTQARQQLGDLDKRLRDAGHDVLRSRLRTGKKRGPVDGVPS